MVNNLLSLYYLIKKVSSKYMEERVALSDADSNTRSLKFSSYKLFTTVDIGDPVAAPRICSQ